MGNQIEHKLQREIELKDGSSLKLPDVTYRILDLPVPKIRLLGKVTDDGSYYIIKRNDLSLLFVGTSTEVHNLILCPDLVQSIHSIEVTQIR